MYNNTPPHPHPHPQPPHPTPHPHPYPPPSCSCQRPQRLSLAALEQVTIRADNVNGYATASSFCSFQLKIAPQPVPPSLTTSVFTMYDLAPLGQPVGDLGLVDNNNVIAGLNYVATAAWKTVDAPDAFQLSPSGAITVKLAVLDGLAKPTYRLTVNASDAISWAVLPVTVNLLGTYSCARAAHPSPLPPTDPLLAPTRRRLRPRTPYLTLTLHSERPAARNVRADTQRPRLGGRRHAALA